MSIPSRTSRFLSICLAVLLTSSVIYAQDSDWKVLAKKDVSYKAEKDRITLYGDERDVSKIKLTCRQGSLKIKQTTLIYSDGSEESHDPKGTGILTKGTSTIPYRIQKDKKLKQVEITYEAYGNMLFTKRAKVDVLGLTSC